MFDSMGTFTKQFTPVDDGYLYHPSAKGGGKLVTHEEYDELVEGWAKIVGRRGVWKYAGGIMLVIVLWTLASDALPFPSWSDKVLTAICVVGVSVRLLWASLAPRRLVRDRPLITPPRPVAQTRREARALVDWRFIIFALFFSGIAFLGSLNSPERDFKALAWLIGSGAMFGLYIWFAIQKFRDR